MAFVITLIQSYLIIAEQNKCSQVFGISLQNSLTTYYKLLHETSKAINIFTVDHLTKKNLHSHMFCVNHLTSCNMETNIL